MPPAKPQRIAHISDLHFPRVDEEVVAGLGDALNEGNYQLIVVSGDLTMRARIKDFLLAREFIDSLTAPVLCIPGNHDISRNNMLQRFVFPFRRFKRFVESDYTSTYLDDHIAAIGVNSVRRIHTNSLDWSRGRVNHYQIHQVRRWFEDHGKDRLRVVSLHHPILVDSVDKRRGLVGRHKPLVQALSELRVDVVLTGHLHRARFETLSLDYHRLLVSQCATSCSTRLKGELNAYNHVEWSGEKWNGSVVRWNENRRRFEPDTEAA